MSLPEVEKTRSLIHSIQSVVESEGQVPTVQEVREKERLLALTGELSESLARIEAKLEASSPPEEEAHRLVALGRAAAEVGLQIQNLLSQTGARLEVAELCFQGGDTTKGLQNLQHAREQFHKVTQLSVAMVDVAGKESHRLRSDLNELVRSTVSFAQLLSQYENIDFSLTLATDLKRVRVDPAKWQHMLLCLFSNAADAIGRRKGEGGSIQITTKNDGAGLVHLLLQDAGRGIAAQDLPHVFDPGFTTKDSREGIGLSTCRSIVEQVSGLIRVESVQGNGTTVSITIPSVA